MMISRYQDSIHQEKQKQNYFNSVYNIMLASSLVVKLDENNPRKVSKSSVLLAPQKIYWYIVGVLSTQWTVSVFIHPLVLFFQCDFLGNPTNIIVIEILSSVILNDKAGPELSNIINYLVCLIFPPNWLNWDWNEKLLSCDLWVLILAGWDGTKGS